MFDKKRIMTKHSSSLSLLTTSSVVTWSDILLSLLAQDVEGDKSGLSEPLP